MGVAIFLLWSRLRNVRVSGLQLLAAFLLICYAWIGSVYSYVGSIVFFGLLVVATLLFTSPLFLPKSKRCYSKSLLLAGFVLAADWLLFSIAPYLFAGAYQEYISIDMLTTYFGIFDVLIMLLFYKLWRGSFLKPGQTKNVALFAPLFFIYIGYSLISLYSIGYLRGFALYGADYFVLMIMAGNALFVLSHFYVIAFSTLRYSTKIGVQGSTVAKLNDIPGDLTIGQNVARMFRAKSGTEFVAYTIAVIGLSFSAVVSVPKNLFKLVKR